MLYSSRRRSALILLAALVVAGCSNSDADPAGTKAKAEVTPSATASDAAGGQSDGELVPPVDGPSPEPSVAVSLAPSVKVGKPSDILPGVRVSVGTVKPVTVKAQLPGELAGPAAAVPVQIRNGSKKAFSLDGLAVTAAYNGDTPGTDTSAAPAKPMEGSLKPGKTAKGTYVFMVPRKYAGSLHLEISSDQSPTIVQFNR